MHLFIDTNVAGWHRMTTEALPDDPIEDWQDEIHDVRRMLVAHAQSQSFVKPPFTWMISHHS